MSIFPALGSPVKAEQLSSKRRVAEDFLDDPRPLKYRNDKGFNDRVRNIVFNYCSAFFEIYLSKSRYSGKFLSSFVCYIIARIIGHSFHCKNIW